MAGKSLLTKSCQDSQAERPVKPAKRGKQADVFDYKHGITMVICLNGLTKTSVANIYLHRRILFWICV